MLIAFVHACAAAVHKTPAEAVPPASGQSTSKPKSDSDYAVYMAASVLDNDESRYEMVYRFRPSQRTLSLVRLSLPVQQEAKCSRGGAEIRAGECHVRLFFSWHMCHVMHSLAASMTLPEADSLPPTA